MSRLEELIKNLCPDGVEYKKIGELAKYEQPSKYIVNSTKYDDSYDTPVLTAGQTFILGYTNETDGIYPASKENPVIIFDDFTGAFKWVDFSFKVKSSAMKMIKANEDISSLRYLFHLMSFLNFSSDEHKRLWISIYSEFSVPVPPLEVQDEIVRILDNFTNLTAELTAELDSRKKQYEYYRDSLLSFEKNGGVQRVKLGEITAVLRGKRLTKSQLSEDEKYPVFHGGIEPLGYYTESNRKSDTVMIVNVGASAGTVGYCKVDFWSSDGCYCLEHSDSFSDRYMFYALQNIEGLLKSKVRVAGIPTLDAKVIENIELNLPPLDIQERIVKVLDNFDAICSDLSIGLPAEIEARQKQYEYYRDKLLSFEV